MWGRGPVKVRGQQTLKKDHSAARVVGAIVSQSENASFSAITVLVEAGNASLYPSEGIWGLHEIVYIKLF